MIKSIAINKGAHMPGFSKSLEFEGNGRIQDTGKRVFSGFYDNSTGEAMYAINPSFDRQEDLHLSDNPLHIDDLGRVLAAPQTEINVCESDVVANGLRIFKPIEPTS